MKTGDSVKVKKGIMSPDYDDLKIEGWQGRITELDEDTIVLELDSITLESLSADYIIDSIDEEVEYTHICLDRDEVEKTNPRDTQNDVWLKQKEINTRYSADEEEKRIAAILNAKDTSVNEDNLKIYLKYLKKNVQKPFVLTGAEDFDWEEPYLLGGRDEREYARLKLTRPSYSDQFELLDFTNNYDDFHGLIIKTKRLSDKKIFDLPLWDLKVVDETSPNYLLISDYSFWMNNY